jgi:3-hydroxyacyl-CoA dehydrogenase
MTVRYEVRDGVAIVALDNPPVNGLGFTTRFGLVEAIDRAESDTDVAAIVLIGAGRAFSAGADIREFNTALAERAPMLPTVIDVIENSSKPVVAALHALALGGGLEVALATHYRVAATGTEVGLPEVRIGVLPGAGGTQRLPRAIGLETALNMIVSGRSVKCEELAHTRLFDRLIEGDLKEGAVEFAREVVARGASHPKVRDWKIDHPNPEGFIEFARGTAGAASKHFPAPMRCIDAIEAAATRSFEEGLRIERDAFWFLVQTVQSKSLRHAFFAERTAAKVANIKAMTKPRIVEAVAVIGAGTMGGGITMNFLNAGIPVTLIEANPEALERGIATIQKNYANSVKKGKLTPQAIEERMQLLRPTLSLEDARHADLLIEAVFEQFSVKEQVLKALDGVAKPGSILATNTSTLDVDRLAAVTKRPEDVLGLHFFSPANVMRLLEVVRGAKTSDDVLTTAMSVAARIGKTAVVSGVCDGFIGNRMLEQYVRQAGFLLDEGVLPLQVDRAIEAFGFAMGPFRVSDLAGNDIGWAIRKRRSVDRPDFTYSKAFDLICERGRFGQKSGGGWYDYKPGDRTAYPSKLVEEILLDHSRTLKLPRRTISDGEIVDRLVYALVNEGANILKEGIAARASDIDVVYLHGYGFPVWRGGPMFHADTVGLYNVLRAIRRYAQGYQGQAWEPSSLLVRLAHEGGTFNG